MKAVAIKPETQVVAVSNATSLLQAITQAASNPQVDIEKMERLFKMHQEMVAQEAEAQWNSAMARAQSQIVPVANNADNTHTKSRYAKLAAINKAIVPIYTGEGLSISFDSGDAPAGVLRTVATVAHAAGHKRQFHLDLPLDDVGAQGVTNKTKVHATGSSTSYARRYLVCMIFNVTTEDDDDGNRAGGKVLPEDQFNVFVKKIEAQTTKEKAKEEWLKGLKACEKIGDVAAANALKAVLLKQGEFIDKASKA